MLDTAKVYSSFSVNDLEAAKKFYQDTLGLTITETDMGLELNLKNGSHIFVYEKENHTPATYTCLNFLVTNIEATIDQLLAKGITMQKYPGFEQDDKGIARGFGDSQGPTIAWFEDPSGNVIALIEEQ